MRNGAISMFSIPPARTTSASPRAISCAAETTACRPEPHILLRVIPGTSTGSPLFMPTCRPGFMPWPAERMLPTITWSTCSPSTPERERTSWPTVAPRSVAGTSLSAPPKVPIPVLRGVEMTISPLPLPLPKLMHAPSLLALCKRIHQKTKLGPLSGPEPARFHYCLLPLLPGAPLSLVQATSVVGEHGVQEVGVGVDRLLGEGLGGLLLLALLLDQILRQGPVALGLGPEVVYDAVEEVLRELRVDLLSRYRAVGERLVRLLDRLGELLGRLVYLLLLLHIHSVYPLSLPAPYAQFLPGADAAYTRTKPPNRKRSGLSAR